MEPKIIFSGKQKTQLIVEGFRYFKSSGPKGPMQSCYFKCVNETCPATGVTQGSLHREKIVVKYHNLPHRSHNHPPDFAMTLNAEICAEFRETARGQPQNTAKALHENITMQHLNNLPSPERESTAAKLAPFSTVKGQYYRITADKCTKFKTVEEVNISAFNNENEDFTKTMTGNDFYRGKTRSNAHIFMRSFSVLQILVLATGCPKIVTVWKNFCNHLAENPKKEQNLFSQQFQEIESKRKEHCNVFYSESCYSFGI